MSYFRKKPVVIEAYRWTRDAGDTLPKWLAQRIATGECQIDGIDFALLIKTLEGTMRGDVGDWIIRGVKGEIYPCKPDIFAATYEGVLDHHVLNVVPDELLKADKGSYRERLQGEMRLVLAQKGCDPTNVRFIERPNASMRDATDYEAIGFAPVKADAVAA